MSLLHGIGCYRSTIGIVLLAVFAVVSFAASPAPLSLPVDAQRWVGYDGNWSPITLRVGSPPQWVYVLPNVFSQETWVIGSGGCDLTFTCQEERGGVFNFSQSSTWKALGPYELGFNVNLGFQGSADYGYDSVGLDQETIALGQVIGIMNSTQWLTGSLGLGVGLTDFTNSNNLTFLSTLVEVNSVVPSHSFGYTAGAYYRLKSVPSSLTLGGVDTNRFEANDKTFTLDPNQRPVVSINEITVSANSTTSTANFTSPLTLSSNDDAALFTIDSSTPFLWLPEKVCDRFADALGLYYNDTLQLYTFEADARNQSDLADWDMTFTFTIADLPDSSNSIQLSLPYDAFDLELTYPFPNLDADHTSPSMKYFPLRRAANETQYTIGRMFLQETYLAVDYERNNFSLSQAKFALDATRNADIVEITRPANSGFIGPKTSASGLSVTTKIGIGVGSGGAVILVGALAVLLLFVRRRKNQTEDLEKPGSPVRRPFFRLVSSSRASQVTTQDTPLSPAVELPGSGQHPAEIPADSSTSRFELEGSTPVEIEGSYVPDTYYSSGSQRSSHAIELPLSSRLSTSKNPLALPGRIRRSDQTHNLPAYSPTTDSHGVSSMSSPSSTADSHGRMGEPRYSYQSAGDYTTTAITPRSATEAGAGTNDTHSSSLSPVSPNESIRGTNTQESSHYDSLSTSLPSRSTSNPASQQVCSANNTTLQSPNEALDRFASSPSSPARLAANLNSNSATSNQSFPPISPPVQTLSSDSGYQLRDEQETRKLERLAKLMNDESGNSMRGNEIEQEGEGGEEKNRQEKEEKRRRRFSWEEDEDEGND